MFNKIMPIIVYQMGKVASSTVVHSLKKAGYKNIFHPHRILAKNIREFQIKADINGVYTILEDEEGMCIDKYNLLRGSKVITLVSEPIERNFSAFFTNYKILAGKDFKINQNNIFKTIDKFMKNYPHDTPLNWFDDEFNKVLNIDIYSYPFDKKNGYMVITLKETSILILRAELEDDKKELAIQTFLNDDSVIIANVNESKNKNYAEAYKSFKKEIILPKDYIEKMYKSKYVQHFYTEDEINIFRKKWNRN